MASGERARRCVDLLIFDLDRTLADTKFDIAQATNFALQRLGLPTLPAETIYGYIGNGGGEDHRGGVTQDHQDLRQQGLAFHRTLRSPSPRSHPPVSPRQGNARYFRQKKKAVATNRP